MGVDSGGNTWVAYVDYDDTIDLVQHQDASAWTSWETVQSNSNTGYQPSIAIDGTDKYILYQDDQENIVYDKYGTSWDGETLIEEHDGSLQDTVAKWAYLENNGSDGSDYGSGGSGIPEIDYLYTDGSETYYNRVLLGGSTPGTQDSIDTVNASLSDNLSLVSDSSDNVHLLFVDAETTDQVSYRRWTSGGGWDVATLVAGAADANDAYVSLSNDTANSIMYAVWIDTSSDDIYYSFCTISTGCNLDTEWAAESGQETQWISTGVNTNVTTNYGHAGYVFAEWTVGSASPYAVQASTVVIPEYLWIFLPMGPLLPLLLRKRKLKKSYEKTSNYKR
ncbi:hypothetical protein ACFL0F_01340 [Patescibacteria group bacterium]